MIAPCPLQLRDLCCTLTGILLRSHLPVTLILDASNSVPCRLRGTVLLKTAKDSRDLAPQSGCACGTLTGVPFVTLPAIPVQCAPQADPRPTATGVPRHRGTLLMQPAQLLRDLDPEVGCPRGASNSILRPRFPAAHARLRHGARPPTRGRPRAPDATRSASPRPRPGGWLSPRRAQQHPALRFPAAHARLRHGARPPTRGRPRAPDATRSASPRPRPGGWLSRGAPNSIQLCGFPPLTLVFGTARGRQLEVAHENPHFICKCHSSLPLGRCCFLPRIRSITSVQAQNPNYLRCGLAVISPSDTVSIDHNLARGRAISSGLRAHYVHIPRQWFANRSRELEDPGICSLR